MPTVADLERLKALVTRLVPLTNAQPRTLIRAEDWNLLVGALIEIARTLLTDDRAAAVPPHDHADQVQLSWLDARLRGLLEKGPLADPAALARVDELGRRIQQNATLLDGVRGVVADVRARVDDVTTRDLAREADVTRIRRTLDSMGDSRADVLQLRRSLEAVRVDLQRAIAVGRQLEVDGEPLDVAALLTRIDELETLRDHLTMPDGQPLDATALELRLTALTNTLVTEEELDAALADLHPDISDEVRASLKEEILGEAAERITTVANGLRAELGARIDDRLSDVDRTVSEKVTEALPGLRDQVLDTTRQELKVAVAKGVNEAKAYTDRRLEEELDRTDRTLTDRIDAVQAEVTQAAEAAAGRQLDTRLPEIRAGIAQLGERLTGLDARGEGTDATLGEHTKLLGVLQSSLAALSERMDTQLAATLEAASAHADGLVEDAGRRLREELAELTGKLVADRVAEAIDGVRGEIREIARDELAAAMAEIDERTSRVLDSRLPDRVLDILRTDFARRGPLHDLITKRRTTDLPIGQDATREPEAAPEPGTASEPETAQQRETAPRRTPKPPAPAKSAAKRKPAARRRTPKKPPS